MAGPGVSDTFKQAITTWAELTDKKAVVMNDLKTVNKKLSDLKAYITSYMDENSVDVCNVRGSRVSLQRTNMKEPLNKDCLGRLISSYPPMRDQRVSDGFVSGLVTYILENRRVKEGMNLRRTVIPGYAYAVREMTERGDAGEDAISSAANYAGNAAANYASNAAGAVSGMDSDEEVGENDVDGEFDE